MSLNQALNNGLVFFSYTVADRERMLPIYQAIKEYGFNVWLDKKDIKGGQNWDFEIRRALDRAPIILLFVSENSFQKRGYIQREIKVVLDKLSEKLIDDIYIIPILLDKMEIPQQLKHIQYIDSSESDFLRQILESINIQFQKLGIDKVENQSKSGMSWAISNFKEDWDGLPGYEISVDMLTIESNIHKYVNYIATIVNSESISYIMSAHTRKFQQDTAFFNHAQTKYQRTDTFDINISEPNVQHNVVSILVSVSSYGAGAAHPNYEISAYNFILDPLIQVGPLKSIFMDEGKAVRFLSK